MRFELASVVCVAVFVAAASGCVGGRATATPAASAAQPGPALSGSPAGDAASGQQEIGTPATNTTPCTARDVTLKPGSGSGDFNGMSHSGTYLILTNHTRTACSVPGLPELTFVDANGPVKTEADLSGARFMHPGPQVLPIVLQAKQSVVTSARWVSGPVFTDNLCYKLTGVTLALRDGGAHMALSGQMCGERGKGVHYDLQRYGTTPK